jgi:ribonuclease D
MRDRCVDHAHTFAAIVPNAMFTPETNPDPPDELARLEKMHQRMKDEQEAWRNLLEKLENLKKKIVPNPEAEKPST